MRNDRLAEARKESGLTQAQLAHKLDNTITKATVSNWETGYSSPQTLALAIKVATILGKDVHYLFGSQVQETQTKIKQTS